MTKQCLDCFVEKTLTEFSKEASNKDGLRSYCRECSSKRFKKWRALNLKKVQKQDRRVHYIRKYGLSEELAEQLITDRSGICPICQTPALLVVDHCHATQKVRDLICSFCNSLLGYSKENKNTLLAAIQYLEKHHG